MRFVHTADWQIGKPFKQFGDQESVLRQARLVAIENIGRLAVQEDAPSVLVAGDIYDTEAPTTRTLLEPLERMRRFPDVQWHLLPGNHDPHRPKGVWDRVRDGGIPANVHLHLAAESVVFGPTATLLPAPLRRKSEGSDLTEWMDRAETSPGTIRVGIAHGSVVGFDSSGEATNPINPRRPALAGLEYLALGDWHRTVQIGPSIWYSGTPEPDRAGSQETGQALIVDIPGPGAPARVVSHQVGTYRWVTIEDQLSDASDLQDLDTRLRNLPALSRTILRLSLKGVLPLAARAELDQRLLGLAAAMFHLNVDDTGLSIRPSATDLELIDFGGVLRRAADQLKLKAEDSSLGPMERRRAEDALVELFVTVVGTRGLEP